MARSKLTFSRLLVMPVVRWVLQQSSGMNTWVKSLSRLKRVSVIA